MSTSITKPQIITIMRDWWPAACATQKWDARDRQKRLDVISGAVGRTVESMTELNRTRDVDAVKARLKMLADSVQGAMEDGRPEIGSARTERQFIRSDLLPCLALYTGGRDGAERYLAELIKDLFHRGSRVQPPALDDLADDPVFRRNERTGKLEEGPSQLQRLKMTLSARINGRHGLRNQAGDTLHDMRTKAGLQCDCKRCCEGRRTVVRVTGSEADEPVDCPF
jgi:hypothetical protein